VYLCKCHFVADDFTSGSLKFGSKPYGARTVQQQMIPASDSAHKRVRKRTLAQLGLRAVISSVKH
jgi:hypothetical protein